MWATAGNIRPWLQLVHGIRSSITASTSTTATAATATCSGSFSRIGLGLRTGPRRMLSTMKTSPPPPTSPQQQSSSEGSALRRCIEWYTKCLQERPLVTKCLTAACISFSGDCVAQQLAIRSGHQDGFNVKRSFNFTLMGAAVVAPILHVWYGQLAAWFPSTAFSAVLKRVAVDQLIFTPAFIPLFFTALMTLEGKASEAPAKLRAEMMGTLVNNWLVWVPVQMINFRFVPQLYQVLFANMVGFAWNIYMSIVSFRSVDGQPAAK